jgi:hypothetical protein
MTSKRDNIADKSCFVKFLIIFGPPSLFFRARESFKIDAIEPTAGSDALQLRKLASEGFCTLLPTHSEPNDSLLFASANLPKMGS